MPSTTAGLRILTRKNELTTDEWCALLETRRAQIKPHLDSFTLKRLNETECLQTEGSHLKALYGVSADVVTADEGLSLETQGLFFCSWKSVQYSDRNTYPNYPDGSVCVWGLTRSGDWIIVEIQFRGDPGYKNRGTQRPSAMTIRKCGPATILQKTKEPPHALWLKLGKEIQGWCVKRRNLYNLARDLVEEITAEEMALEALMQDTGT